jgi:hypothetical protein
LLPVRVIDDTSDVAARSAVAALALRSGRRIELTGEASFDGLSTCVIHAIDEDPRSGISSSSSVAGTIS